MILLKTLEFGTSFILPSRAVVSLIHKVIQRVICKFILINTRQRPVDPHNINYKSHNKWIITNNNKIINNRYKNNVNLSFFLQNQISFGSRSAKDNFLYPLDDILCPI